MSGRLQDTPRRLNARMRALAVILLKRGVVQPLKFSVEFTHQTVFIQFILAEKENLIPTSSFYTQFSAS